MAFWKKLTYDSRHIVTKNLGIGMSFAWLVGFNTNFKKVWRRFPNVVQQRKTNSYGSNEFLAVFFPTFQCAVKIDNFRKCPQKCK